MFGGGGMVPGGGTAYTGGGRWVRMGPGRPGGGYFLLETDNKIHSDFVSDK